MEKLLQALLKIDFLKMVDEVYQSKKFFEFDDDKVSENETVVGQANELEKAIFSAKCEKEKEVSSLLEKIEDTQVRSDLPESDKEDILINLRILQIKIESDIQTLASIFWGIINSRLPLANSEWDSLGVRKNWEIVGFNIDTKEKAKSLATKSERALIDQNDILIFNLLNDFYFSNQLLVKPNDPVAKNETVVGEMNNYEKCMFNIAHFNRVRLFKISEKMKAGETFNLHEVETLTAVAEIMDKLLYTNIYFRFSEKNEKTKKELGIREDWKVVSYFKNSTLN